MPTLKTECRSCGGTGLYQGSSEWGDCAVVCVHCLGTGGVDLTYEEFTGRKPAQHVKRVFRSVAGAKHTHKDADGIRFSRAGCTYASWIKGAEPLPVRELYCPYRWTAQAMQNPAHPAHDQYQQMCGDLLLGRQISLCPRHQDVNKLAACWRRFDELMSKGEKR
jgi:hypothetical protein